VPNSGYSLMLRGRDHQHNFFAHASRLARHRQRALNVKFQMTSTNDVVKKRKAALASAKREIGIVNAVRFINQFTTGYGDYTRERDELFAGMTLDDIVSEIKRKRTQTQP